MAGVSFIKYKDQEILYIDHRGLRGDDVLKNMVAADVLKRKYNEKVLLFIADFRDAYITQEVLDHTRKKESVELYKNVRKSAVLGISGIKKVMLNAYNIVSGNKSRAFDTEEEAKEWLIK